MQRNMEQDINKMTKKVKEKMIIKTIQNNI